MNASDRKLSSYVSLRSELDALRRSVRRLPILLCAVDRSTRILMCDGGLLRSLELEDTELLGQRLEAVWGPRPALMAAIRRALAGESLQGVINIQDATLEAYFEPLLDDEGEIVGAVTLGREADASGSRAAPRPSSLLRPGTNGVNVHLPAAEIAAAWAQQQDLEGKALRIGDALVATPTDALGRALGRALAAAGDLAGADRAYLLVPGTGEGDYSVPLQWSLHAEDRSDAPQLRQGFERLALGEVLHAPRAASLFHDEPWWTRMLEARGTQSILVLPVQRGDEHHGALLFETVRRPRAWIDPELNVMRTVARMFGGALSRIRAEHRVRQGHLRLLHSEKMDSIVTFAQKAAQTLEREVGTLRSTTDLAELQRAAGRADEHLRTLRSLGSSPPRSREPVIAQNAVVEATPRLREILGRDIRLLHDLDANTGSFLGDQPSFTELLLELGRNARHAMPSGGEFTIAAWRESLDLIEASRVGVPEPGDYVVVSVSDTGTGMHDATVARIFEPFFTTQPDQFQGLGLTRAYGIITRWHGAVVVDSVLGRGTAVDVYLPVAPAERKSGSKKGNGSLHPKSKSATGPGPDARTILVVDDDRGVRRIVCRLLVKAGYTVHEASDGVEALELDRELEGQIDLVVSDVDMPRMDGVALVQELRNTDARNSEPPRVLLMSGHPDTVEAVTAKKGPDGNPPVLPKPFSTEQLLDAVQLALS